MKLYDYTMTVDEALSIAMDALSLSVDYAKISGRGSVIPKFEESKTILNAIRKSQVPQWDEGGYNKTIIVPANDADDLDDEAQYFQSFLKKAGVKTEVEAGIGELEIHVAQRDYKKAVKTIQNAGYQID